MAGPKLPTIEPVSAPARSELASPTPNTFAKPATPDIPVPQPSPKGRTRALRVLLLDGYGEPTPGATYELRFGELALRGTCNSDGLLEEWIPETATGGVLVTPQYEQEYRLVSLPPANNILGLQHRLMNLGYAPRREPTGVLDEETRMALQQFQYAEGLRVTGTVSAATAQRLQEVYGG